MAPCWRRGASLLLMTLWLVNDFGWAPAETVRTSSALTGSGAHGQGQGPASHERVKRGWVWNQFFVVEEYTGTEPLYVGKIHSDSDNGEGMIKYTISGEGAGTIFIIEEITGDIHATQKLDREEKAFYTLRAQARDRYSSAPLEPESEFVIKVQDINDNEPKFLEAPYIGSVAELSPIGTSVMKVAASDEDDPTYGSSARVVYSVLDGEKFFTVDRDTGVIRTAVADLDRETQDRYELVVKATDMAGQMGGLSGSTTVTIVITDVNDNSPTFPQKIYQFSASEGDSVGTPIGSVMANDADMGDNTDMSYFIVEGEDARLFKITTDAQTQEAVISIKEPLDFETKQFHTVMVEAVNKHVDERFVDLGTFQDRAIVNISVSDVDEPPLFLFPNASSNTMEVQEDARLGALVGFVNAKDPDKDKVPVRYSIDRSTDQEHIFNIDPVSGAITLGKILDRETAGWHNITVMAVEADNPARANQSAVSIRILDVNDNPPELATPFEASICEDAKPDQIIHTISVVDKDEPQSGHRFYFTLAPEASSNRYFTLMDTKGNTASIRTQRSGFNRHEQNVYLLPILVVDSGPPALSSTGTITIHVCGCDTDGAIQSCNATAYVISAALSPGALIALLVCMLILIVLVLLILTLKRHRKGQRMSEDEEDMRDNVIKYNDEGGGEQDTQAYDMSALRSLYDFPEAKSSDSGGGGATTVAATAELPCLPQWIQSRVSAEAGGGGGGGGRDGPTDFSLFRGYIRKKVEQADADLSVPPYDSFQTYAFEGNSSPALSLSSIRTLSTTSEQDFSYLSDWGPRFRQLAGYYAPGQPEEEGS
ncbi:cadherin-22-like [Engraulis encrasicolus]|uniref:cadherin-22-like n=1 Tax=Engraulis encrasicolus TaxID=184585 RepID=UPI002FD2C82C